MKNLQRRTFVRHGMALGALAALGTPAAQAASYAITMHDDRVEPETLHVPAGKRVKIQVTNARALPAEFESVSLAREKIIPTGATLSVWVGPLKPGKYQYFDDFNPSVIGWIEAGDAS